MNRIHSRILDCPPPGAGVEGGTHRECEATDTTDRPQLCEIDQATFIEHVVAVAVLDEAEYQCGYLLASLRMDDVRGLKRLCDTRDVRLEMRRSIDGPRIPR